MVVKGSYVEFDGLIDPTILIIWYRLLETLQSKIFTCVFNQLLSRKQNIWRLAKMGRIQKWILIIIAFLVCSYSSVSKWHVWLFPHDGHWDLWHNHLLQNDIKEKCIAFVCRETCIYCPLVLSKCFSVKKSFLHGGCATQTFEHVRIVGRSLTCVTVCSLPSHGEDFLMCLIRHWAHYWII